MKALLRLYIALILIFLYAPLAVMVIFSFNSSNSTSLFAGFSLRWYAELFESEATLAALKNTFILAILSSVIATALGTIAAVGILGYKRKWIKSAVMSATNIPMMNPDIVTGVSMMLLFVFIGKFLSLKTSLGFTTVLIAHITFNLPYVIYRLCPSSGKWIFIFPKPRQTLVVHLLRRFLR